MTKAVVLILVLALFEPGSGRPNVEKREAPENEELVAREDQVKHVTLTIAIYFSYYDMIAPCFVLSFCHGPVLYD